MSNKRETAKQSVPQHETNDYSFMLQSIEKRLASTITAQANDFYQRSGGKKQSAITNTDNTIELPSQIALHSTPVAGANPFVDPSLSSIQLHPSILKKRRISSDSLLNSDESTFLYNPEDHTVEVVDQNPKAAGGAPFSRTITLQSQIDELKIINETQREQIRLLKLELENTKDTSIKQLGFLENQNKRYKQELEEKTNKYYDDKKKWQQKVKEIEERYQKKSLNPVATANTSSSTTNTNEHYTQFIKELQQQLQSVNELLSDKFTELETLSQQKSSFEKKAILLENEVKTLKMQLQFNHPTLASTAIASSSGSSETSEMISKQEYYHLQDKALEEKLSFQKQIASLEKTIQNKQQEMTKMKETIRNQLLLEEKISQLTNEKLLFEEKQEEYLSMERKYYSLIEEKKHLQLTFTKIQQLLQPNQTTSSTESNKETANAASDDVTSGMISHVKILTLIQALQEKYLLLMNDYHLLQSKQGLVQASLEKREGEYQELLRQYQTSQTELQKKDLQSSHSRHQIQSFEREIRSLRDLLQTYDFEFTVSQGKKKATPATTTTASHEPVSEDTLMKLKNELIEKSQRELDELRGRYGELLQRLQEVETQLQSTEKEKQRLEAENQELQKKWRVEMTVDPPQEPLKSAETTTAVETTDESEAAALQEWKAKYEELMNNYQGLQEVSGIDYLPSKTKILRFIDNPSMVNRPDLSSSAQLRSSTFPPERLQRLQAENHQFQSELKELKSQRTNSSSSAAGPSSSSTSQSLNLSDENIPYPTAAPTNNNTTTTSSSSVVDPNKLNQRLKEIFREKINTLRNGIYLLTGYQVELSSTETLPRFKLKSMYAENIDDYLIFQMDGDNLQLLESKYALSLDSSLTSYMTKYQSIPAFLSNLTLHLFENQTFMA